MRIHVVSCVLLLCVCVFIVHGCSAPGIPASADAAVELPIIMYHSVLRDPSRTGQYTVTPEALKNDMLYLKNNGYTSITLAQLYAFVSCGGALPERPVLITFDDGHYNNLTYALPILEELDMYAVVSVVGSYTEKYTLEPDKNPSYAYLSYPDILDITASGHIEAAHHSFDMHSLSHRRGSADLPGESRESYRAAFTADTVALTTALEKNCGITPTAYAYPYGIVGEGSEDILRELGFVCSFTCREQVNRIIPFEPSSLFGLGRFNRSGLESTAEFMQRVLSLD